MSVLDLNDITTQKVYSLDRENIDERVPGKKFADRIHHLYTYWDKTHKRNTAQLIGDDLVNTLAELVKKKNDGESTPN